MTTPDLLHRCECGALYLSTCAACEARQAARRGGFAQQAMPGFEPAQPAEQAEMFTSNGGSRE